MRYFICNRKITHHEGWFYLKPHYRCPCCEGIIRDKDYIRKIIDYNTPKNIKNREDIINKELLEALTIKPKIKKDEKFISIGDFEWKYINII